MGRFKKLYESEVKKFTDDEYNQLNESTTDLMDAVGEHDNFQGAIMAVRINISNMADEIAAKRIPSAQKVSDGFKVDGRTRKFVLGVPEVKRKDVTIPCFIQRERERGADRESQFKVNGSITLSVGSWALRIFNESPF